MDFEFVKNEWNKYADEFNQWTELSEEEKVDFAIHCSAAKAAGLISDKVLANT